MSDFLFNEFETTSAAAWKQKIQVDLKGLDYNQTLLWKTEEDIVVKPFYTADDRKKNKIKNGITPFSVCQTIFIDDEKIANSLALDALKKGADAIQFIAKSIFDFKIVLQEINTSKTKIFFKIEFLDANFINNLSQYKHSAKTFYQIDIIGNLAESGNWYHNLNSDFEKIKEISSQINNCICVDISLYENAGASIVQQLAYGLAHANEYLEKLGEKIADKIHFIVSVRGNYFFEIAKLRAFRILFSTLLKAYNQENSNLEIFVKPSLRNKTLYDYNVNMLRTTSESMSGILGGASTISNVSYDEIYHKSNEFGERISRNQLLILKEEANFENANNFAEGSYYIEALTNQLSEKALELFKKLEKSGGFLKLLKDGIIQKKITEKASKEQEQFDKKELILLGSNLHENKDDKMSLNLELYPFVKQRNIKTLLSPIIRKRLSETYEKNRLETEKK